jgi:hypothetical protein
MRTIITDEEVRDKLLSWGMADVADQMVATNRCVSALVNDPKTGLPAAVIYFNKKGDSGLAMLLTDNMGEIADLMARTASFISPVMGVEFIDRGHINN